LKGNGLTRQLNLFGIFEQQVLYCGPENASAGSPLSRNLHNHFPSRLDFSSPRADIAAGFSTRLNWSHAARIPIYPSSRRMATLHDYLARIIDPFDDRSRRFDGIGVGREFRSSMRNARVTPVAGYGLLLRSLAVLRRQRYINIAATHRNTPSRARSDCRW